MNNLTDWELDALVSAEAKGYDEGYIDCLEEWIYKLTQEVKRMKGEK